MKRKDKKGIRTMMGMQYFVTTALSIKMSTSGLCTSPCRKMITDLAH